MIIRLIKYIRDRQHMRNVLYIDAQQVLWVKGSDAKVKLTLLLHKSLPQQHSF